MTLAGTLNKEFFFESRVIRLFWGLWEFFPSKGKYYGDCKAFKQLEAKSCYKKQALSSLNGTRN